MNSSDRSISIVMGFISAAFVAVIFMVSSCTVQETHTNLPVRMISAKAEHFEKMRCIEARGDWNEYGRCVFTK